MRDYYTYGEMILLFREEYNECKKLLDEIDKLLVIEPFDMNMSFKSRILLEKNIIGNNVIVDIKRRCSKTKEIINELMHRIYEKDMKIASAEVSTNDYEKFDFVCNGNNKNLNLKVRISDEEKFKEFYLKLLRTDFMNLDTKNIYDNAYVLRFDNSGKFIIVSNYSFTKSLKNKIELSWNGDNNSIEFSMENMKFISSYIMSMLKYRLNRCDIPDEWLKILDKHEHILDKETEIYVDLFPQEGYLESQGSLNISEIRYKKVKNMVLLEPKKYIRNNKKTLF